MQSLKYFKLTRIVNIKKKKKDEKYQVLVRIWSNLDLHMLLVGVQIGTTIYQSQYNQETETTWIT